MQDAPTALYTGMWSLAHGEIDRTRPSPRDGSNNGSNGQNLVHFLHNPLPQTMRLRGTGGPPEGRKIYSSNPPRLISAGDY